METPEIPSSIQPDPIRELTEAIKLGKTLADEARADLIAATPVLIAAIRHHSGQSAKVERVLWSCWNDDHQVNLCSELTGLDAKLARAVLAMISARTHCGGEADELLRQIISQSGSQPPAT
ncbi:MAG: hypothetical protein EAZ82_12280 [Verrucomicrobia bacterium]|nr:MAG: hypothetical protein EAZ82_12280 [Verrucomicrobiota bacterium]